MANTIDLVKEITIGSMIIGVKHGINANLESNLYSVLDVQQYCFGNALTVQDSKGFVSTSFHVSKNDDGSYYLGGDI